MQLSLQTYNHRALLLFQGQTDSEKALALPSITASILGEEPTTCKQRFYKVLPVQTRLGLQESAT